MTKSERLKPLVKVAESKEKNAAKELGECVRIVQERQQRLDQLKQYRQEYAVRFQQEGASGISAQKMNDYRAFIVRLDAGIKEQERLVIEAQRLLEDKKSFWHSKRSRTKALDNAVSRYRTDELRAVERREQRESDERAMHDYRNKENQ
jgi:flagellar FliJ protein